MTPSLPPPVSPTTDPIDAPVDADADTPARTRPFTARAVERLGSLLPAAAGVVTALLMLWHLTRPALWLDESATTVAREHTWPHLMRLLLGSDAPLVPYYVLLKALDAIVVAVVPALGHHPAVLARWPSVVAVAGAVTLLTWWVRRVSSATAAAGAAVLLILSSGLSRYGQEGRPYALVLLLAVTATVLWWTAIRGGTRWAWPVYGLTITALVSLHVLAATLVVVHVAAALVVRSGTTSRAERRRRARTTALLAIAGLALAAPLTLVAVRNGRGATAFTHDNVRDLLKAAGGDVVALDPHPLWLASGLVLLCVIGVTRWRSPRYGDLVRVTTLWTVIPLLAWALATWLQPNLLIGRYILFVLPAFTTLAAVGLLTAAGWLTGRLSRATRPYLTGALMVPVLALVVVMQAPALAAVRARDGHGEDIRPVLAAADEAPYRRYPLYVAPPNDFVEVEAVAPGIDRRVINAEPRWGSKSIWPAHVQRAELRARLRQARDVIFVVRKSDCLPGLATVLGYRVIADLGHGGRTWFAFLAARGAGGSPGVCPVTPKGVSRATSSTHS